MSELYGLFDYGKMRRASAGTIVYPPGGRFGPRIQENVQLVLLHTGSMALDVDGEKHAVQPGSMVLLPPGHKEMFVFAVEQETWHRWIEVHVDGLSEDERLRLGKLPFSLPISEEMNRITDLMLALRHDHPPESDVLLSLGMSAIQLFASEISRTRERQGVHPSVQLAKNAIQNRFGEELNLQDLAHTAGLSPEHLVRLFHAGEETTPIKYLWQYRVLRALEMLTHTGLTITEISARCGFKTTYHFARMVKHQTGKTPTEIRTSYWTGR